MTVEEIRGGNGDYDNFPVGMRVLAVDDDPICLKLLDGLLRKCQYHVTTTSQARVALNMLRENKDRYDLVISDVHMPDMDGFKLLELVGLEMDLPVIMLSANSDPKLVMKGVTHGACDYLVKPVRIEELRNIWQHVIRKKKIDPENQNQSPEQDKTQQGNGENGQGQGSSFTVNSDQSGKLNKKRKDDEYEDDENDDDNDDPSAQKKPRVVWSIELHRKFVGAVNQLGIEKAVPKRILDMMNVEGLTRENVASHLQKYRLYLKRISSVASQQANMYAALGSKDSGYMRMGSLDGLGDFRSLTGQGRLGNNVLSSYTQNGMLGRLNSPSGSNVTFHNLASSTLIPLNNPQSYGNSVNSLAKLHPSVVSSSSLELDRLDFNPCNAFTDTNGGGFGSQSQPLNITSSFNVGNNSSNFLDHGNNRCNENWQNAQNAKFHSPNNNHGNLGPGSNLLNPLDLSGSEITPMGNLRRGLHSQEGFVSDVASQKWDDNNNSNGNNNNIFGTMNTQSNGVFNRKMDMSQIVRSNGGASTLLQREEIEKTIIEARRRANEEFLLGQMRAQASLAPQGYDSLDDLMSAMIKREQEGNMLDGEFGFDAYSFRSTM